MEQILADIRNVIEQSDAQEGDKLTPENEAKRNTKKVVELVAPNRITPEEVEGEPILLTNMVLNDGEVTDVSELTPEEIEIRFYKKIPPFNISEPKESPESISAKDNDQEEETEEEPLSEQPMASASEAQAATEEKVNATNEAAIEEHSEDNIENQDLTNEELEDKQPEPSVEDKQPASGIEDKHTEAEADSEAADAKEDTSTETTPEAPIKAEKAEEALVSHSKELLEKLDKTIALDQPSEQEVEASETSSAEAAAEQAPAEHQAVEVVTGVAPSPAENQEERRLEEDKAAAQPTTNTEVKPITKEAPVTMKTKEDTLLEEKSLISEEVAVAASAELAKLASKPQPQLSASDPLEALVREAVKPMLKEWLDQHLVDLVREIVATEVKRLAQEK